MDLFLKTYWQLCGLPRCRVSLYKNDFIVCELFVRPTHYTEEYLLCINYEKGYAPRIWIINPEMHITDRYRLPHVFPGNRLCLYHSRDWRWIATCDIRKTLIVWSMMWIVNYEYYKINSTWIGSEAEHDSENKENTGDIESIHTGNMAIASAKFLKNNPITLSMFEKLKKRRAKNARCKRKKRR